MANVSVQFGAVLGGLLSQGNETENRRKICETLGIAPSTLSAYVRNRVRPSFEKLVVLAATLEVSLDYLVLGVSSRTEDLGSVGPYARMLEARVTEVRRQALEHTHLVGKVGDNLAKMIDDATARAVQEQEGHSGGIIDDEDVQKLESFSTETRIISLDLAYDFVISEPGYEAAGSFAHVVAENLRRGRKYKFMLAGRSLTTWESMVKQYRNLLAKELGGRDHLSQCEFKVTATQFLCGLGLYKLDRAAMESKEPMLDSRLDLYISAWDEFGYLIPPNEDIKGDLPLDLDNQRRVSEVFDKSWSNATKV